MEIDGVLPYTIPVTTKTARLDLRMTAEQRDLLEQAASIAGSSLASYSITVLVESAAQSVARARTLVLSAQDWDEFVAALDAPDEEAWIRLRSLKPVWEDGQHEIHAAEVPRPD